MRIDKRGRARHTRTSTLGQVELCDRAIDRPPARGPALWTSTPGRGPISRSARTSVIRCPPLHPRP